MPYKSKLVALCVATTLLLSGCATITHSLVKVSFKPVEKNFFSGRPGINGPVLIAKIDDTNAAHPQIGLEDADIVYIEQVEGGLTRLAAVFSSVIPQRIGPIRSARISDIDLIAQFGHIAFAYSGAQQKLLPVINAANLQNLGAQAQPPSIYTRDPARNSPYSMVLRADLLMAKTIDKGYVIESAKSVGWSFNDKKPNGVQITRAQVRWPAANYGVIWSASENRWHLTHNNEADLSDTGRTLGPTTFVIQLVSITPSIYGDKFGGITPFSQTIGQGTGYILRDGMSVSATWSRASANVGTTWKALDGSEIAFAPGQVWVALCDTEPDFTLVPASASPSPTK